jgi:hypothetical protein
MLVSAGKSQLERRLLLYGADRFASSLVLAPETQTRILGSEAFDSVGVSAH